MNSTYQSPPPLTSVSSVTRGMVATLHFVVAAVLIFVLFFSANVIEGTRPSMIGLGTLTLIILPIASIYLVAGLGILRWNKRSRYLSLGLNWLNIFAAVLNIARQRVSVGGAVGVLLSLFVVWWLSVPTVKAKFESAGRGKQ